MSAKRNQLAELAVSMRRLTEDMNRALGTEQKQRLSPQKPVAWVSQRGLQSLSNAREVAKVPAHHSIDATAARLNEGDIPLYEIASSPAVQQDAMRWISVYEAGPEEGQTVAALIYPYNNEENRRIVTHAIYRNGTFLNHEGDDLHPPTHWMPIPDIESAIPKREGA